MTIKQKIYLAAAAAAVITATFVILAAISDAKIGRAERDAENAIRTAQETAARAAAKEKETNEYKAKIEYLERQLGSVRAIAERQEQQAGKLAKDVAAARTDAERAARVRSITVTAADLCRKLAELGHPCSD